MAQALRDRAIMVVGLDDPMPKKVLEEIRAMSDFYYVAGLPV